MYRHIHQCDGRLRIHLELFSDRKLPAMLFENQVRCLMEMHSSHGNENWVWLNIYIFFLMIGNANLACQFLQLCMLHTVRQIVFSPIGKENS